MNRLARTRTKKKQGRPPILRTLPIDLAPEKGQLLFAGLERFVNTGDSLEQYKTLSVECPTFWPKGSDAAAWSDRLHPEFLRYRDCLRSLWSGSLKAEQEKLSTVAYLLGLITWEETNTLFMTGPEALWDLLFNRPYQQESSEMLSAKQPVFLPVWGSMEVRFFARGDFDAALWALFRESWRARVCECQRCFVAHKAATRYCSVQCHGNAKRGQKLKWWNKAGAIRRKATQARAGTTKRKKR